MKQTILLFTGLILFATFLSGGFKASDETTQVGGPVTMTDPNSGGAENTLQLRSLIAATPIPGSDVGGATPTPNLTPGSCQGKKLAVDLLLDVSGSMNYPCGLPPGFFCGLPTSASKITVLNNTVKDFLAHFQPGDLVSVQVFNNNFNERVPLETYTDHKTFIDNQIDIALQAGSNYTWIKQALEETGNIIIPQKAARPDYNWALIFLTDGYPEDAGGYFAEQDPTIPTDVTKPLKDPPNNLRIITIGYDFNALGVNKTIAENVLQTVASPPLVPGQINNYPATTADLEEVYNSIATDLCR